MRICAICKEPKKKNVSFFAVPQDERREQWKAICKTEFTNKNAMVCESHFSSTKIINFGRKKNLMPNAYPEFFISTPPPKNRNEIKKSCICGCADPNSLYIFPNNVNDRNRRNIWLNYFGIQDPNTEDIYACDRHFSSSQSWGACLRFDAVPDVPFIQPNKTKKHEKKKKTTSSTGEINHINSSVTTTTNEAPEELLVYDNEVQVVWAENLEPNSTIEIPILKPEYRVSSTQTNVRLCGSVQASEFANEYLLNCYYCCETFPLEKWKNFIKHLKRLHYAFEEAFHKPKYVSADHDYSALRRPSFDTFDIKSTITPNETTLIIEPKTYVVEIEDSSQRLFGNVNINPLYSGVEGNETGLKIVEISEQNSVIKNDHITSPKNFKAKVKRKNSNLKSKGHKFKSKVPSSGIFYIKNFKRQTSNQTTLSRCLKRTLTDTMDTNLIKAEPVTEILANDVFQQKSTELTYEYTPKDIIDLLLDSMKNYSVLWQFEAQPFIEDYYEATEELCKIINKTWSLNIDNLKMRRSINRVLRFYLSVYPLQDIENINQFTSYYDKCAEFLPKSVHDIAYARCSHCYMCFTCDFDLKSHLLKEQSHLHWPYKCLECKECFQDRDEFEFHKMLPHYQEVFRCKKCPKTFTRRNLYNRHLAIHRFAESKEPGKHKCNLCDKVFKYKGTLNDHILGHGEKKFKCHLCPKSFHLNAVLNGF